MTRTTSMASVLLLVAAGCSGSSTTNSAGDATSDTASGDAVADSSGDAHVDAGADTSDGSADVSDSGTDAITITIGDAPGDILTLDGNAEVSFADAISGDDAAIVCGTQSCTGDQICLRTQVQGGVVIAPGDGGTCPSGYTDEGGQCARNPSYSCIAAPSCDPSGGCTPCGSLVCTANASATYQCTSSTAIEVDCQEDVP